MLKPRIKKLAILLTTGLMMPAGTISQSYAQSNITLDGTTGAGTGLGQDFSGNAGPQTIILEGGGADRHGTVNGSNLFFSFNQFGIASGDTAQFQCTGCGALTNVISRVTGNASSLIDGTLRSVVPNANFWFFNPNGVVFGAGSVVDVPAALHVSSGNLLNFGANQFDVTTDPNSSSLSFADPSSFGFTNVGDITVSGTTVIVGGAVEIAAANNLTISNNNTINSTSAVNLTANNAGGLTTTNVADNATVINTSGGGLNLSSPGEIVVGTNATFNGNVSSSGGAITNNGNIGNASSGGAITNNGNIGNASSGGVLTNNGNINGSAHAAVDVFNTSTARITDGVSADRNVNNSGYIWGGSVTAGQDITNTGAIILNKSGDVNLIAGQNLINTGDGVNTGIIQINHDAGPETIRAGYDMVLGQNAGQGVIQKQSGSGNLNIIGGSHALLVNNSGSRIEDNSAQGGSLTVTLPAGNLDLAAGTLISKSGDGTGLLKVDVQAGNLIARSGAKIVASQNSPNDLITASGAIDNSGELTVEQVHANAGLVNQVGAVIAGNATAESGLNNAGNITQNAFSNTGDLQTTGTISGNAQATAGSLVNAGYIGGYATAGINLTNQATGRIDGSAQANQNLTNAGNINQNAIASSGELINSGTIVGNAEATTGNLTNSATITGTAIAGSNLTNNGNIALDATAVNGNLLNTRQINGNAVAGNDLTNQSNALIRGFAHANQTLTNAGTIIQNATAGTNLFNQGNIGQDAVAGINLDNQSSGFITGNATAAQQLSNGGIISVKASAGTILVNSGRIESDAVAVGNLDNQASGVITGGASSSADQLKNSGVINGDASAGTDLINQTGAVIDGNARAAQQLSNAGNINLDATADGPLSNEGAISGNASAGTTLVNKGRIGSGAASVGNMDNQASGVITGKATSSAGQLTNSGVINGNAEATVGNLTNNNTIKGNATAGNDVYNSGVIEHDATSNNGTIENQKSGLIKGDAFANQGLINAGTISLSATSTNGQLTNNGSIFGAATTVHGDLNNTGTIAGKADSGGNLTNHGAIGLGATSSGNLDNQASGVITGDAQSKLGQLTNNGTIDGDADATAGNLTNNGVINGANVTAGQDLQVSGSKAVVNLMGINPVKMSAGSNLTIDNGAQVNVTNTDNARILAGGDLTVSDNNTKISANNSGAMLIRSGTPPSGGNINIINHAEIKKSLGTDLQITANKSSLMRGIPSDAGGQIIIDTGGKLIADQPKGTLSITAKATALMGQINSNGTFKSNDPKLYGLQITTDGSVKTSNRVNLNVEAQTVYLQGNQPVSGEKGTMTFTNTNPGSFNLITQPQQFKIKNSSIINKGAITLDNYYLDLDGNDQIAASGIKSSSIINLKLSNLPTLSSPRVVAGIGAKNKAERFNGLTSYLDGKLSTESTNINDISQTVKSASSTIVAKPSTNPGLPKNPCESRNGQSTLNTNTPGTYQPGANAQLPYSILSTTTVAQSITLIPTATVPSAPAKSDEC